MPWAPQVRTGRMAWEISGTVLPNQTANFRRSVWQAEGCGDTPPAGGIPNVCERSMNAESPAHTRRSERDSAGKKRERSVQSGASLPIFINNPLNHFVIIRKAVFYLRLDVDVQTSFTLPVSFQILCGHSFGAPSSMGSSRLITEPFCMTGAGGAGGTVRYPFRWEFEVPPLLFVSAFPNRGLQS